MVSRSWCQKILQCFIIPLFKDTSPKVFAVLDFSQIENLLYKPRLCDVDTSRILSVLKWWPGSRNQMEEIEYFLGRISCISLFETLNFGKFFVKLEMNFRKLKHGFCLEWAKLEKYISFLKYLSWFEIFKWIFDTYFS